MKRPQILGFLIGAVLVAGAVVAMTGADHQAPASASSDERKTEPPSPMPGGTPTIVSRDGKHVFTVPQPGDPEWDDYQEMMNHPTFRMSVDVALPYDPEWRSELTGRRAAEPVDILFSGGQVSLTKLAELVLDGITLAEQSYLHDLRVDWHEFRDILWPEFPHSRPYLRLDPGESWLFHQAQCREGVDTAFQDFGRKPLRLVDVEYASVQPFTNFEMYQDCVIKAVDESTGELLSIPVMRTVVERHGSFKVYMYDE